MVSGPFYVWTPLNSASAGLRCQATTRGQPALTRTLLESDASKRVEDPFSYRARWDSAGVDCSDCKHFEPPPDWPDRERVIRCGHHQVSLAFQLNPEGFKEGEWFCRYFLNRGSSWDVGVEELSRVQESLDPAKIYGASYGTGLLKERDIAGLGSR